MSYSAKVRLLLELDAPSACACGENRIRLEGPLTGWFTISVDDEPQRRRVEVVSVVDDVITVKYFGDSK